MYLDNKYTRVYYQIIDRAKDRNFSNKKQAQHSLGYVEEHHIIPKSLGGKDSIDNLVLLTAREHFICHWLLIKMTTEDSKAKMVLAIQCMILDNSNHERTSSVFYSRVYEKHRSEIAVYLSESRKGIPPKCAGWNRGISPSVTTREKLRSFFTGRSSGRKGIKMPHTAGMNHPNYDHELHTFIHDNGTIVTCTQYELRTSYNLKPSGTSQLMSGTKLKYKGWKLA